MFDTTLRSPGQFAWSESVAKDRAAQSELHQAENVRIERSDAVRVAAADIVKPPRACVCRPRQRAPQSVIAARGSRDGKCQALFQPGDRGTGMNA
jgi:hypothetical protein